MRFSRGGTCSGLCDEGYASGGCAWDFDIVHVVDHAGIPEDETACFQEEASVGSMRVVEEKKCKRLPIFKIKGQFPAPAGASHSASTHSKVP